jgi:hypothetical protein
MVDQNFPEGADRMVIIKGQRENVTRAAAMINELIAGEPGSASAIIAKVCLAAGQCSARVGQESYGLAEAPGGGVWWWVWSLVSGIHNGH